MKVTDLSSKEQVALIQLLNDISMDELNCSIETMDFVMLQARSEIINTLCTLLSGDMPCKESLAQCQIFYDEVASNEEA